MPNALEYADDLDRRLRLSECQECEARLRHVLAYISEKRHRRWIASTAIILLIYYVCGIPFDFLYSLAFDALRLAGIGPTDIFSPGTFGLVLLFMTFLPPIIITLVIFSRLRRIYRGY
ncbi:MAG: hypothetical protein OXH22_09550 [Chloroflexi bacterium]|nr:hypothetical protein [Chloroflexota bacterium]